MLRMTLLGLLIPLGVGALAGPMIVSLFLCRPHPGFLANRRDGIAGLPNNG
jgi:hypothetical protein